MDNPSLTKLRSIAHFLKVSSKYNFQNYNLSLFMDFLLQDPQISIIINNLLVKNPKMESIAKEAFEGKDVHPRFDTFEKWVAYCVAYIKVAEVNQGDKVIDKFIIQTGIKEDDEGLSPKLQFYNDCIEPILIYIELQIKHSLDVVYILQRYKTLCEWYDKEEILQYSSEPEITKNHLSRFLFDQGFTYSLSETIVPSGRIDNFALNLGISKEELSNLPEAIVIEGKIFKEGDNITPIQNVKNQVEKRIQELNFQEGYCVVYNKSNQNIEIENRESNISGIPFLLTEKGKHIFFIIINLGELFYKSTETIDVQSFKLK